MLDVLKTEEALTVLPAYLIMTFDMKDLCAPCGCFVAHVYNVTSHCVAGRTL